MQTDIDGETSPAVLILYAKINAMQKTIQVNVSFRAEKRYHGSQKP